MIGAIFSHMSDFVESIFNEFISSINEHNVDQLIGLLSNDHIHIDSYDQTLQGKEAVRGSWMSYFEWFPDYHIDIEEAIAYDNKVAAFGYVSGTFRGMYTADGFNYWRLPVAIKTEIKDGRIRMWQIFSDTRVPLGIIERNQSY